MMPLFEKKDAEPKGGSGGTPLAGAFRVEIGQLSPDPGQPRRAHDDDGAERLEALAQAIKTHGILQPLVARREGMIGGLPHYRVISGHRRLAAAAMAGQETLPVIVRQDAPKDIFLLQLIENLHREDLSPLDEGLAYKALLDRDGVTARDLGRRLGISDQRIRDRVRVVLHPATAAALREGRLPYNVAREILKAAPPVRDRLCALLEAGASLTEADLLAAQALPAPDADAPVDEGEEAGPAVLGSLPYGAYDPLDDPLEEYLSREGAAASARARPLAHQRPTPTPAAAPAEAAAPLAWDPDFAPLAAFVPETFLAEADEALAEADPEDDDGLTLDGLASGLDRAATAALDAARAVAVPQAGALLAPHPPMLAGEDAYPWDHDQGAASRPAPPAAPRQTEDTPALTGAVAAVLTRPRAAPEPEPERPTVRPERPAPAMPKSQGRAASLRAGEPLTAPAEPPIAADPPALVDWLNAFPPPTLNLLGRLLEQAVQSGISLSRLSQLCAQARARNPLPSDQQPI